jgi:hypothetical protein
MRTVPMLAADLGFHCPRLGWSAGSRAVRCPVSGSRWVTTGTWAAVLVGRRRIAGSVP